MPSGSVTASGAASEHGPLAAIRRQFPGWAPWRSSAGRFWATRTGPNRRRPDHAPPEWALTVDGDDAAQLRQALQAQEAGAPPGR
jgi:hypothetical protein